ncbi:MAG TPA: glycosyltransferase family 4 protein, partial [Candidatus Cybelea sp.]|nr:glycosyltransferase family 4 protein [Candidatus Cybelea sp.]
RAMLKVLHVTRDAHLPSADAPAGGLERAVHELVKAQRAVGIDASVVGPDVKGTLPEANVVHAHDWYAQPCAERYFRAGLRAIVVTSHLPVRRGFTYRDTGHAWNEKLQMEAQLFDLAAAIVAPSSFAASFLSTEYGMARDRLHVIAHGVDAGVFRPPAQGRSTNGAVHVITASRVTAQKGVELFLRTVPYVAAHISQFHATIVGDGDALPACKRLAERLGISERIAFRHAVPAKQLADIYASASLLVMPSLFEPFGLAGLEALACGCPVLAIRPTGADYLHSGELTDSCSPARLARAIVARLHDDSRDGASRESLRERALRWPWDRAARLSAELYAAVMQ